MENVEQFYSYGDMPPWGKGPTQGKIYGHPEYIEENFPLTDKFIHCKVERLNVHKEGSIIYKADKKTDEEEFAQARAQGLVGNPGMEENNERELLQVQSPYRPHMLDQPGLPSVTHPYTTYGGIAVLAVMGIGMMLVKSRKKETGKSN